MSGVTSIAGTVVWATHALAWLCTKLMWLALLLVGLFFVLLMAARIAMNPDSASAYWNVGLFFGAFIPIAIPGLANPTAMKHRHASGQPHLPITIRRSWWATGARLLGLLMMASALGRALASGIDDGFESGLAVAGVVLFAGLALSLIRLQLTVSLALTSEGLDYSLFRIGPISWQDIGSVDVERVLRSDIVVLHLRDEEKYYRRGLKRLTGWARFFASTPFMLPDAMFDVSPEWLRHAIEVRLAHFRTADKPQAVERQGSH
jgi:hypothetical protein